MTDRWVSRLPERESEVDTMSKSKHNHEVKDYSAKAPIIEEIKNLLDSCQSAVIEAHQGAAVPVHGQEAEHGDGETLFQGFLLGRHHEEAPPAVQDFH